MDNTTFRIVDVAVEPSELVAALKQRGIRLTRRTDPKVEGELLQFALPIGPYKPRWLFRINPVERSIGCSGGVTKTFFGHNVWVFRNEAVQLRTIVKIVAGAIADLPGVSIPDGFVPIIERAELTRHHALPDDSDKADALRRLDLMQMTLLPSRYSNEGRNHDDPGTTRIGKNKSSRAFRLYDPAGKFGRRPAHIPPEAWARLCAAVLRHLRAEVMFNKRELESANLDSIDAWEDDAVVTKLLESRYQRFGLSVAFRADQAPDFTPATVGLRHPSYLPYIRHFFSAGAKGNPPNPRSGSAKRYKDFMLENGYSTAVPFDRHQYLVHGLHEILRPELAADLAPEIRSDKALFRQWWNAGDA